jgi:DNA-binding transcriptional LysR family regulator
VNYDWLSSFVAFSEHLNFTHAARQLHISQPALHVQITKLADSVGRPLYRRKGRVLSLTAEGTRLAAFGREVQDRGKAVLEELRGTRPSGPVVLASGQGAFLYLLGPAIRRFPKDRYLLRLLTMRGPDVVDAVLDAHAHLGVAAGSVDAPDLEAIPLRSVGQVVVVPNSHRLARKRQLEPKDLSGERLVVAPVNRPHRMMLDQVLETANVDWQVSVEATGWEPMLHFARLGLGITVVNDFCPAPRGMVAVPLRGVPSVTYSLIRRAGVRSHPAELLSQLIVHTRSG